MYRCPARVVAIVAGLALSAGLSVITQARTEIAAARKAESARETIAHVPSDIEVTISVEQRDR